MHILNSPLHVNETGFYRPNKEVMHLFASGVARKVAQAFIIVFSSVYIYENLLGFGFDETSATLYVVIFFLIVISCKLLFLIVAENLSRRSGFKSMIWLSSVPFVIYIPSLIFASGHPMYFLIAAIAYGAHSGFYWWGYNGYFIKAGDSKHYGQGLGEAVFLNTLAVVATPAVGAVLIDLIGFPATYVIAGLFMFLSLILLGKDKDRKQKTDVKVSEVIRLMWKHKSATLAYMGSGVEGIFYIFGWPLFLFLLFGSVVKLGAFVTASALIAAVVGIFIGKKIDEQGERGAVALSSPILAFSWLIKAVSFTTPVLMVAESLRTIGERVLTISLLELSYKKAAEALTARAILFREFAMIVGIMLVLIVFAFWIMAGFGFPSFFVVVGIASLLPMIAVYRRRI